MSASASFTCHCGTKFEPPADVKERRVNCPTCGSVIFLAAAKVAGAEDEEEEYGIAGSDEDAKEEPQRVEGIPEWLERYRSSPDVKKLEREKTLSLIERLAMVNPTLDSLGATLYVACSHADAETSVAALTSVVMSGHPAYAPVAAALLEHLGPSEAAGAQQVVVLLSQARNSAAEQAVIKVLRLLGPTPIVHVRHLIDLLGSKHTGLYLWSVQCLNLIGPPAKRACEALLKALKIPNAPFRIAVVDALGAIGGDAEHVVPVLLQALKNDDADLRAHACQALGRYGPRAASAAPSLNDAAGDAEEIVRQSAAKALQLIAAGGTPAAVGPSPVVANGQSPESISVVCACGKRLKAKAELAGKKVKCPACSGVLVVPGPRPPAASAPSVVSPGAPQTEKECPTCLASVPTAAVLCVCCGFDFR